MEEKPCCKAFNNSILFTGFHKNPLKTALLKPGDTIFLHKTHGKETEKVRHKFHNVTQVI